MRRSGAPKLPMPIVEPLFFVLAATSVLCAALIAVREFRLDTIHYRFLLWNLFLAWLPLFASMAALALVRYASGSVKLVGLPLLAVAWLLLFPNAPYLTTDFIHLVQDTFDLSYDKDGLLVWYDLVLLFLFAWCGLLLGYLSMRHFHAIASRYLGTAAGWIFVPVVSYLGGFGVYLGRVVRLNSWDVLFGPFRLIGAALEAVDARAAGFAALFGTLILIVYVSLFALAGKRSGSSPRGAAMP
ncbi:DUF1361 domain-containing protein [Paenibacillaceae bacterium WGS1546]|uniref:DUF1361 domain-containing protein n=1 Tax=Cohnella sp. WGS1546 TaxID=3366810 RepID=UPI00372D156D